MLNKDLKSFLRELFPRYDDKEIDQIILFLIACKCELHFSLDDKLFMSLATNNIIERDFIKERIVVKIPIFENEGEIVVSKMKTVSDEDLNRYRLLFRGIRQGSIGNKEDVRNKLTRFINLYSYDMDTILTVVSDTVSGDTTYIPNADNFIFNNKGNSPLLLAIEDYQMKYKDFKSFA